MALIVNYQTPPCIHPGKVAFNFPALTVPCPSSNEAIALRIASLAPLEGEHSRLDTAMASLRRFSARSYTLSATNACGRLRGRPCLRGTEIINIIDAASFSSCGWALFTWKPQPVSIGNNHHLRAFTDLRVPAIIAPFLAGTKLLSHNA
ncbi:MAG: hypothetical protein GFH27_549313n55 [Chloroflexi bacterium AL-W]|nr:hypothetical protein [Chloroflexi bacterium AL-N1]NOK69478.1 hypothetical protein [Chloroflexi bacterium AL-N10]NOK77443.1 hypothetical protein [Chloroflexi bacterium AL-N5]NOK84294.1 hypothetical protein [Chloroflexi bacterium AL-W]NOK91540.1 hypothetical protein [Chloroflexi bacterium AL-N15]